MKRTLWTIAVFVLIAGNNGFVRADDKKATKEAKEAFLGVAVDKVPAAMRSQSGDVVPNGQGIIVVQVAKDSPASKAGLKANDILLSMGDQKLTSPEQLVKMVRSNTPGQSVDMNYVRNGKSASCKVTLGENQNPMGFNPMGQNPTEPGRPNVYRFFPDENFQRFFEESGTMNGEKGWSSFESMKLSKVDANHWSAEIEYKNKDGKKENKKFSGTREELRKQIQGEKDLPDNEKHHLLRALNLHPPVMEFYLPPLGNIPQGSSQQP